MVNPLKSLARPERFELPTHGFVVRCSIQLSYGRAGYKSLIYKEKSVNPDNDNLEK